MYLTIKRNENCALNVFVSIIGTLIINPTCLMNIPNVDILYKYTVKG